MLFFVWGILESDESGRSKEESQKLTLVIFGIFGPYEK